ncbi:unnamed protein product [Ectocarpus sp. CCAP 1310/34]|nr:unnamed protein product [Ectocarpus sp. CCAP 1310/34]
MSVSRHVWLDTYHAVSSIKSPSVIGLCDTRNATSSKHNMQHVGGKFKNVYTPEEFTHNSD